MRHHMPIPEITVTTPEHHDLLVLAMAGSGRWAEAAEDLLHKLERARIVTERQTSEEVVRMGSRVTYRPDNGVEREVTLVYPVEADIAVGKVSVLTPIGTALLGLRTGQATTWTARDGRDHVLEVLAVHQRALA